MRLLRAKVTNFASYSELSFNFNALGLSLIYGPTGSGKSTLQDIATWILYGVTAKGGNADEILSWNDTNKPTIGSILVQTNSGTISVTRVRGKSSENDLYWTEQKDYSDHLTRGKDITETQKLLEERLGVPREVYISGAQYNEFSPSGSFFTAKAKDRRELFENLADLSLPVKLAERVSDAKKGNKKVIAQLLADLNQTRGQLSQLERSKENLNGDIERWRKTKEESIKRLEQKVKNFEAEKKSKIESLNKLIQEIEASFENLPDPKACPTCGRSKERLRDFNAVLDISQHQLTLGQVKAIANPHKQMLEKALAEKNPFLAQKNRSNAELSDTAHKHRCIDLELAKKEYHQGCLEHLYDLSIRLRGELIKGVAKDIEHGTNKYLEKYFDAEIRVQFELDGDNLTVLMFKNGHACVFTQLSKGQRCLLKLCFSLSLMKSVANKAGVHFGTLMLDESLDGLDADLKVKAFGLLSELATEHESVLVVEHSVELQNLFETKYRVELVNDESVIHEES